MGGLDQRQEAILAALRVFVPEGQVTELRVFQARGEKAAWNALYRDHAALARKATELEAADPKGVYFVPNPVRPGVLPDGKAWQRGSVNAEAIARRRWLLIDADPDRIDDEGRPMDSETNSSDAERADAWEVIHRCRDGLDATGFKGAVLGDSGNGFHLCYPVDLAADDAAYRQVSDFLAGLQFRYGTDRVKIDQKPKDAPRIWKLYGTPARKGPHSKERPHRRSQLIEGAAPTQADREHNNGVLADMLAVWERQAQRMRALATPAVAPDVVARARAYIAKEPPAVSGQRGHDRAFHVACILMWGFALTESEAFAAVADWNAGCQPPWSEGELRHKFADAAKATHDKPRGYLRDAEAAPAVAPSAKLDLSVEPPPAAPDDVATIHDLIKAGSEIQWLWPGWIPTGVLTVLAAEPGTGKTRFAADLVRRIRHGLPWPDGAPMTTPRDAQALWVMSDNHHDEIVTLAGEFGIVDGIRINASRKDPYGGVTLDDPKDLASLEARIKAVRPALVFVDTVGNATDKNLTKSEDAKAFYQPLQVYARRNRVAIVCVTHLNAGGKVLGRRALEKVRSAIQIEKPDDGQPNRRRLWVAKSNSKTPDALGVTMGTNGNEYDKNPPTRPESEPGQAVPETKVARAVEWLQEQLTLSPKPVGITRNEAELAGFDSKTLYKAKERLGAVEYESQGRKWWKLAASDTVF